MIHTTVEARWTKREKESNKHRDSSPNESEKKKKKKILISQTDWEMGEERKATKKRKKYKFGK